MRVADRPEIGSAEWERCVRVVVAVFVFSLAVCHPASADPMTLDFTGTGRRAASRSSQIPKSVCTTFPAGATSMSLTLTQGVRELGGQDVPVPGNGILPFGTIRTFGPCKPGLYEWTALVKSSTGQLLSEAHQARLYPSDEPAPGH